MREPISLLATTCGLLAAALLLLGWGIWQRRKQGVYAAGVLLLLSASLAGWTGWRVLHKAYAFVVGPLRPRSGEEIYAALLGTPQTNCVQILQHQDQVIPKIDYAIWLHYRTCPAELKRVLARHPFTGGKIATGAGMGAGPYGETMAWFKPAAIGDTVLVYEYATPDNRNIQTFWASPDSTEVFCRDIAD